MPSRARNKLTVKQVAALTESNVYFDGGGLYLRVRPSARSWFYIGTLDGKRIELGLGSTLDVSLAKARERAAETRAMILDGIDPRQHAGPPPDAIRIAWVWSPAESQCRFITAPR